MAEEDKQGRKRKAPLDRSGHQPCVRPSEFPREGIPQGVAAAASDAGAGMEAERANIGRSGVGEG